MWSILPIAAQLCRGLRTLLNLCINHTYCGKKSTPIHILSNMTVNQALSEYLSQCNKGEHVVLKSYLSFSKSIVNRQCFLYNFSKIFEVENNNRNGLDYYQLFRLLCSDFPKDIVLASVKIFHANDERMMQKLLDSEKFLHSLYIHFIYNEYTDSMLQKVFKGNNDVGVPLIELFEWILEEDKKNIKTNEKPSIGILLQLILNFLKDKNLLEHKGLLFLNQDQIQQYVRSCISQKQAESKITYDQLIKALLENKTHSAIINSNLSIFDNSTGWAGEAPKLLMTKDVDPQPLNSKKMKKK